MSSQNAALLCMPSHNWAQIAAGLVPSTKVSHWVVWILQYGTAQHILASATKKAVAVHSAAEESTKTLEANVTGTITRNIRHLWARKSTDSRETIITNNTFVQRINPGREAGTRDIRIRTAGIQTNGIIRIQWGS